jgi:hypothetical protein
MVMNDNSNATETNSRFQRSQQYNLRHLLAKKCNYSAELPFWFDSICIDSCVQFYDLSEDEGWNVTVVNWTRGARLYTPTVIKLNWSPWRCIWRWILPVYHHIRNGICMWIELLTNCISCLVLILIVTRLWRSFTICWYMMTLDKVDPVFKTN